MSQTRCKTSAEADFLFSNFSTRISHKSPYKDKKKAISPKNDIKFKFSWQDNKSWVIYSLELQKNYSSEKIKKFELFTLI